MTLTWGAVNRPKEGQRQSGDDYLARRLADHRWLIALIDGLGGGQEAAFAATRARAVLEEAPFDALEPLVERVHHALAHTRGAVLGLLLLDEEHHHAHYIGVGNIGVFVHTRRDIHPISKNGIVGYRLPPLLRLDYTYDPGDLFVLYSDGVSSTLSLDDCAHQAQHPQHLAEHLLRTFGKTTDDASVMVVRTGSV